MKKDIYIIKNKLNDKAYIGQSKDVKSRFQSHCKPSVAKTSNSYISKAIQKHGRENFWWEVLEEQVENYNEREEYWIRKYNSIAPNGYNLSCGGEDPPVFKGCENISAILNHQQVEELTADLKLSNTTMTQLAEKYGFKSVTSVSEFNKGETYIREISYPIRKEVLIGRGKLKKEDVDEIINTLKTTYYSYGDIAEPYGVEYRAVARINRGLLHKREDEEYPIREGKIGAKRPKFTYHQITEINSLLLNTSLSLREIARQFDARYEDILHIKNGSTNLYRRRDLTYPLRPNN